MNFARVDHHVYYNADTLEQGYAAARARGWRVVGAERFRDARLSHEVFRLLLRTFGMSNLPTGREIYLFKAVEPA